MFRTWMDPSGFVIVISAIIDIILNENVQDKSPEPCLHPAMEWVEFDPDKYKTKEGKKIE